MEDGTQTARRGPNSKTRKDAEDIMKALERKNGAAGFTLIEMAIVLVVIGLIIGAVLKGQDLIANARAKKFANFVRQAEVSQYAYYDRNGAFLYKTGPMSSAITSFTNSTALGAATYYVAFGRNATKNAVVVVRDSLGSPGTWSADDVIFGKSFDASINGVANGNTGKVFALTTAGTAANGTFTNPTSASTGWSATGIVGLMYLMD